MSLVILGNIVTAVILLIGAVFILIAVIGLLKFKDPMTRLHAPTKVGTMGMGMMLLASVVHSFVLGEGSMHELLILAFLFVTAPISANFIAKVTLHKRNCETPLDPPQDEIWSTFDVPAER